LGDLDLGLETYWGATEMEMNVQLPTCDMMARHREVRLHPDCSWKNVNVYHWIKIIMRISRADPEDPTGHRRRHFEISIDSPFTILNCRATQANTSLPEYSGQENCPNQGRATTCGCPDAAAVTPTPSPSGTLTQISVDNGSDPNLSNPTLPTAPEAVHFARGSPGTPSGLGIGSVSQRPHSIAFDTAPRPIHLLRVPSYNPPAFDAEQPPPPVETPTDDPMNIMTPPPRYDVIIGTPSVDGMADYFTRLATYNLGPHAGDDETDEDDSDSLDDEPLRVITRSGRVTVANPRTPGGMTRAPSRSLDIERPVMNLSLDALMNARIGEGTPTAV
jgi:hypothetical protein